ncbi:signal peptidase I [bacterium]|nr:signal peptidase I [bacterium]
MNENEMRENTPPERQSAWGFIFEIIKFAVIAAVIVLPIRIYVAQPFIVKGASMDPTFENGQYLIVDEITYYTEAPKRGDVIIFKYPKDPSKYFIKRIVGLPEETVVIANGDVTIQSPYAIDFLLDEPYVLNASQESMTVLIPKGHYFVMGDNRTNSLDSRSWGTLPEDLVIGRALVRLLPVDKVGLFPGAVSK